MRLSKGQSRARLTTSKKKIRSGRLISWYPGLISSTQSPPAHLSEDACHSDSNTVEASEGLSPPRRTFIQISSNQQQHSRDLSAGTVSSPDTNSIHVMSPLRSISDVPASAADITSPSRFHIPLLSVAPSANHSGILPSVPPIPTQSACPIPVQRNPFLQHSFSRADANFLPSVGYNSIASTDSGLRPLVHVAEKPGEINPIASGSDALGTAIGVKPTHFPNILPSPPQPSCSLTYQDLQTPDPVRQPSQSSLNRLPEPTSAAVLLRATDTTIRPSPASSAPSTRLVSSQSVLPLPQPNLASEIPAATLRPFRQQTLYTTEPEISWGTNALMRDIALRSSKRATASLVGDAAACATERLLAAAQRLKTTQRICQTAGHLETNASVAEQVLRAEATDVALTARMLATLSRSVDAASVANAVLRDVVADEAPATLSSSVGIPRDQPVKLTSSATFLPEPKGSFHIQQASDTPPASEVHAAIVPQTDDGSSALSKPDELKGHATHSSDGLYPSARGLHFSDDIRSYSAAVPSRRPIAHDAVYGDVPSLSKLKSVVTEQVDTPSRCNLDTDASGKPQLSELMAKLRMMLDKPRDTSRVSWRQVLDEHDRSMQLQQVTRSVAVPNAKAGEYEKENDQQLFSEIETRHLSCMRSAPEVEIARDKPRTSAVAMTPVSVFGEYVARVVAKFLQTAMQAFTGAAEAVTDVYFMTDADADGRPRQRPLQTLELWVRLESGCRHNLGLVAVPYEDGKCTFPALAESLRVVQLASPPPVAAAGTQLQQAGGRVRVHRSCLLLRVSEESAILRRVGELRRDVLRPLMSL